MILDIECSSIALNNFLYITKTILNIIMIVAPILAIISLVILFTKMTINPDNTKLIKNLKNAIIALVVIFFIPVFVNLTMSLIGNKTDLSSCYNSSQKIDSNAKYNAIDNKSGKKVIITNPEYESGYQKQLDFSCSSKIIKGKFSCDTIRIVERHLNDVNYYNFHSVINSYGGFQNYVNSLGGVFKRYYGKQPKVTSAYEFQLVSEYVFGFMTMYGFDYFSGKNKKYCKWGGGRCLFYNELNDAIKNGTLDTFRIPSGSSDAFYPGTFRYEDHGFSDKNHFDRIVSGRSGLNMTTSCNYTTDMVYYKAGIFGQGRTSITGSSQYRRMYYDDSCTIVKDFHDVQVGDIVEFFKQPIDLDNINTWKNWYHVSFVGEVNPIKETFTTYEGGSYLTINRNHKEVFNMNKKYDYFAIFHIVDLE